MPSGDEPVNAESVQTFARRRLLTRPEVPPMVAAMHFETREHMRLASLEISVPTMNPRLRNAHERLEKAIARVDAAIAEKFSNDRQVEDGGAAARIAALAAENEELRALYRDLAGRLDAAISHLQRIMNG